MALDVTHSDLPARRLPAWARIAAIMLALAVFVPNFEAVGLLLGWPTDAGTFGASFAPAPKFAPGHVEATKVVPGLPMAQAGVAVGDHLRFDRRYDYLRPVRAGEQIGFTIQQQGTRHQIVAAITRPPLSRADANVIALQLRSILANLIIASLGMIILLRCGRQRPAFLLGLALLCYSVYLPQLLEGRPPVFQIFFVFYWLAIATASTLLPAFAVAFNEETTGVVHRWRRWALAAAGVGVILFTLAFCTTELALVELPILGDGTRIPILITAPAFAFTLYVLYEGWQRSTRYVQTRYAFLLLAVTAMMAGYGVNSYNFFIGRAYADDIADPVGWVGYGLTGYVFPALASYAILRHRVLDIGFAINRTLVYGAVSVILLISFGLSEWAVEHFLPIESHNASLLLDAGIALTIFLAFHRLRDFVEHRIEALFFRGWHHNEAQLRTFVREAHFIGKAQVLRDAFVAELRRFSGGAACALYMQGESADFVLAGGEGAHAIDADLPVAVKLRAMREAIEIDEGLALPMIQRADLTGFLLLGAKPSGGQYRPDERELLAWSAHEIGLDLYALKVEQLETAGEQDRREIFRLTTIVETLGGAMRGQRVVAQP